VLIPAIDLQGGRVVQLQQGERLALAFEDLGEWLRRFAGYPLVQVIDLDAARGRPANDAMVACACAALPCRVGGGIRTVARAREVLGLGAREVIAGSALFNTEGANLGFANELSNAIGRDRLIAAVDARGGRVTIQGWTASTTLTPVDAVRALEPFVGGFLYTIVDGEGLMQGIDVDAVRRVRNATSRRVTAAGGISSRGEVDLLDRMGVDAVVGMALYTGRLDEA
jgi:phosphoribosylformimino-5-aminoimidazole carboxamide ribotide isomerase